jgi:tetratricopeptide (TPR) repeat protein
MTEPAATRLERALGLRALAETKRRDHGDAAGIAPYEEAIALMRELDQPLLLAHTVRHLGDILRHTGDLGRSRRCYDEALALYLASNERPSLDYANALRGAALLQEQRGESAAAADLWAEARPLYDSCGVGGRSRGSRPAPRALARRVIYRLLPRDLPPAARRARCSSRRSC